MCYYNGVKVTRTELIRLKQLEKLVANYDFLNKPLQIGFEYASHPVLKRIPNETDFDIVEMEWGFIPNYIKTRDEAKKMRFGYKDDAGVFHPMILTLNAISENWCSQGKYSEKLRFNGDVLFYQLAFLNGDMYFP